MTEPGKTCRRCQGFCPSGVLDNLLCLDCDETDGPEAIRKREFALALAMRSPFWDSVVWNLSLL